jgi:hypothetical protein
VVKRNLEAWKGEWNISTLKQGNTGFFNDFLDQKWKDGEVVHEEFGTFTVDEDGNALLTFRNSDFSDTLLPYTAQGYLHDYGDHHLELYGLKIIESSNPELAVGQEICNDGNLIFWLRDNSGGKRIIQLENMVDCGITSFNGAEWFLFEKK